MTKSQATKFKYFSKKNAESLQSTCKHCKPYKDWFTFGRWVKQGFHIKKGGHATRIPILIEKGSRDRHGKVSVERYPITASVFCRCQVEAK